MDKQPKNWKRNSIEVNANEVKHVLLIFDADKNFDDIDFLVELPFCGMQELMTLLIINQPMMKSQEF